MLRRLLFITLLLLGFSKPSENLDENFVYVKGGYFEMGDNFGDGSYDEKPVHKVYVDNFYISKYEVTQKEYEAIMGVNPFYYEGENNPVEYVSWYDALKYCNAKSRKEGLPEYYNISDDSVTIKGGNGYRLPTEAEWEYAARGGQLSKGFYYSGSNDIIEVAWYWENSGKKTHPVGTKKPNELGLYDMSGNVWEWCWDWYDEHYYSTSPQNNPTGPESGSSRVLRGGSWYNVAEYCRLALRGWDNSSLIWVNGSLIYDNTGFRVLRTD